MNHELQDPTVSFLTFDPGFRVWQYELLNNKNIWWSNLRGMGLPLLGNDIQAAPLFPLVLLLSWVPFEYFWNMFVVLKMILLGAGVLLIGRDLIKFKWLSTIFFTILFIYNLYVIRWTNHPWHNGFVAGVWYIYFMGVSVELFKNKTGPRQIATILGIALSSYSILTCGFPESSVMAALLMVLVLGPYFMWMAYKKVIAYKQWGLNLLIGNSIGFALASPQLFSIFEYLSLRELFKQRTYIGIKQYEWSHLFPLALERVFPLSDKISFFYRDNATFLGIIPMFFFFLGMLYFLSKPKKWTIWTFSAIACFLFILFKLFPTWPLFNNVIGSLPILRECYFFIYFLTIFIFVYSYFAAMGFEKYILLSPQNGKQSYLRFIIPSIAFLIVFGILNIVSYHSSEENFVLWAIHSGHRPIIWGTLFFVIFCLTLVQSGLHKKTEYKRHVIVVGFFIICALFFETKSMMNLNFPNRSAFNSGLRTKTEALANIFLDNKLPIHEVRLMESHGLYASSGIATIDNGATAILPERLARYRRSLFVTKAGGYYPIVKKKRKYSHELSSVNIKTEQFYLGNSNPIINWQNYVKKKGGIAVIDSVMLSGDIQKGRQFELFGMKDRSISLSGWAYDDINHTSEGTTVYAIFTNKHIETTIPTIKVPRMDVAGFMQSSKYDLSGYFARLHTSLLRPGEYTISLRIVNEKEKIYYEQNDGYEVILRDTPSAKRFEHLSYLGTFSNRYLYFNSKALSRAYTPQECIVSDSMDHSNELIRQKIFTPGSVVVEELTEREKAICKTLHGSIQPLRILEDRGKLVDLEEIIGPGIVVLNDNYYPGWYAYDRTTGEKLPIRPANLTFRAVVLEEAKPYQISFRYQPKWLNICYLMVGAGMISILVLFVSACRSGSGTK